jgi:hypothetical protein
MIEDLPLFAQTKESRSKLEKAFWDFHERHPSVYRKLVSLARQWKEKRGATRLGIATLYETARWSLLLDCDAAGIKLNNNHRAYFSRLIAQNEPDLREMFQFRQQRIAATIGPDNARLPVSLHVA